MSGVTSCNILGLSFGYIYLFIWTYSPTLNKVSFDENTLLMKERIEMKDEFLSYIGHVQSNCSNPLILIVELSGNGLGEVHHLLAQALLIALATGRRLHIVQVNDEWNSMYEPFVDCEMNSITLNHDHASNIVYDVYKYYLLNEDNILYFNNKTWNQMSTVSRYRWLNGIYNAKWFGKYGNVFIRSLIQYYIWMHLNKETLDIIHNNPIVQSILSNEKKKEFIGIKTVRDNTKTLQILQQIKSNVKNDTELVPLFIDEYNDMITVEILRLSDYIIGSSRDTLFRLGMELHYATNCFISDYYSRQTAYSIDIPWIQDP